MLGEGRLRLRMRVLQRPLERGRVSGGGRAGSGANGTVASRRHAELGGLRRFEARAGRDRMEGRAALVLGVLSRRERGLVDGHAGKIRRLAAGEEGFVGIVEASDQLEVANDILLHRGDCVFRSASRSAPTAGFLLCLTVTTHVALLVGMNGNDELGQVEAPLHLVSLSSGAR